MYHFPPSIRPAIFKLAKTREVHSVEYVDDFLVYLNAVHEQIVVIAVDDGDCVYYAFVHGEIYWVLDTYQTPNGAQYCLIPDIEASDDLISHTPKGEGVRLLSGTVIDKPFRYSLGELNTDGFAAMVFWVLNRDL